MNDYIEIRDLVVFANHGVLKEEKTMGQKFVISLRLYADMTNAICTDDLDDAVNYAEICEFVTEFTKKNRCKLIEAAADGIARSILVCYPLINRVDITLHKPWAPIGLPLSSVAVNLCRRRSKAYISIGSNMGNRKRNLDFAVERLKFTEECDVKKVSSYIDTKPVGFTHQDDFLNACIEIETILKPDELLKLLNEIENEAGRTREIHWGPRTLDLDIILYGDTVVCTDTLTIPHKEMSCREFVLAPLCEIAPYAYDPVSGDYVINMLDKLRKAQIK